MKNIFFNSSHKLRSGFAIALAYIVYMLIGMSVTQFIKGTAFSEMDWLIRMIQRLILLFVSVIFCFAVLKQNPKNMGLEKGDNQGKNLILGLLLGIIFTCFIFIGALLFGTGVLENDLDKPIYSMWLFLGIIVCAVSAVAEELFFRAYVMNALKQINNVVAVIVIASMFYAYNFIGGQGSTFFTNAAIVLFGVLLCYMYYKTKSLFICIGFNFGWQYAGNYIFSLKKRGVYNMDIIKEGLLGGGGKGPQYGIIAIVLIALIFLFINVYVYNSKKIAQNKKEKKEETDQLWQEAKQKGEQETLFCHENVYEDQYDGIMPIDDMDDREYSDDSYGDRD